jgi:hypothetical protein
MAAHDYAIVFIDGVAIGTFDRGVNKEFNVTFNCSFNCKVQILV